MRDKAPFFRAVKKRGVDWKENGLLVALLGMTMAVVSLACVFGSFLSNQNSNMADWYLGFFGLGVCTFIVGLAMMFKG